MAPTSYFAGRVISAKARRTWMCRRGVHADMRRRVCSKVIPVQSSHRPRNVADGGYILAQRLPLDSLQLVVTGRGAVIANNVLTDVALGLDASHLAFMSNILTIARYPPLAFLHLARILAIGKGPLGRFDGRTPVLRRPRSGDLHRLTNATYQQ